MLYYCLFFLFGYHKIKVHFFNCFIFNGIKKYKYYGCLDMIDIKYFINFFFFFFFF